MKPVKAWAVVPLFSELADVVRESLTGTLVPFFDQEDEADEWRSRTNRCASTKVVRVEIREAKRRKKGKRGR